MKWRNSKERELLATGTGSRDQTLPNKNNPNPDLSDTVCDRNPSVSPGSTSSTHSDAKATSLATNSADHTRDEATAGETSAVAALAGSPPSSAAFLANIYNGKLGYPSNYKVSPGDYEDSSDSSMNSDEEINVT